MTPHDSALASPPRPRPFPRAVAVIVGIGSVVIGIWAMAAPRSFFDSVADFEPYNQHFLQDIGAFQIGLGAVLLLAIAGRHLDGLTVALFGVGIGTAFHALSHVIGRDLGGSPAADITSQAVLALLLLAAGAVHRRHQRSRSAPPS